MNIIYINENTYYAYVFTKQKILLLS